jgi:tetratricopeptide (TPR) repeat protein
MEFFQRALERAPENIGVHYNRGVSLMRLRRYEAAAEAFTRTIALHTARDLPVNADVMHAHHNLGSCLAMLRRKEDALDHFDVVAELARAEPLRWQEEARRAESLKFFAAAVR